MAVQEQTPYIEYTANGIATSFALEFDCDNRDHLIVLVDDIEPVVGAWSFSNGAVVFNTAPENGKKITLQRNTPFNRLADYQSYNNSFRPPAINKDFDRIWWKLQELGVADWILSNRIIVNPIAQTSATSGQPTPQGNLSAMATAHLRGHGFTKSFTEHSIIIGLVNVRADLTYQNGLNRMFSRKLS